MLFSERTLTYLVRDHECNRQTDMINGNTVLCTKVVLTVNKCSAVAGMGDHVATIDMSQKLGDCAPLGRGGGYPSNTMWPGLRPASLPSGNLIHPAIWPQHTWVENLWAVLLRGRGAGFPFNTIWRRPRPTSMPSFILIHPAIWPQ